MGGACSVSVEVVRNAGWSSALNLFWGGSVGRRSARGADDGGIPGDAVGRSRGSSQQRGRDRRYGLPVVESVTFAAGQVLVAGGHHGIVGQGAHTARQAASRSRGRPRREIRDWPVWVPLVSSRGHSPACLARARALSKRVDRRFRPRWPPPRLRRGPDAGEVVGQPELVEHLNHAGLHLGQPGLSSTPIVEHPAGALQRAAPLGCHSAASVSAVKTAPMMRRQARWPPSGAARGRTAASVPLGPRRARRRGSPLQGSNTTASAAHQLSEFNGCAAAASTAGQAHSSRSRSC